MKKSKKGTIFTALGAIMLVAGGVMFAMPFILPKDARPELSFPIIPSVAETDNIIYSDLTGLPLANAADKTAPAYCVQTPNGMDGARPQAGLDEAGVVFEAIAEAGITRFAAIYQNPTSAVIGPIRSLRLYYLQWDTPFDCAIVHAGGADDAIEAVRRGGYVDLSENYAYMYRGGYSTRLWNNLFTTSYELRQFSEDYGFEKSEIDGFSRMRPSVAEESRIDALTAEKLVVTEPAEGNTDLLEPKVASIAVRFGGLENFNVNYYYNVETNSYDRSYESGVAHEVYVCPREDLGERNPEDVCELQQLSPSVVAVMFVREGKAEDNYHEDIAAVGSGEAVVFQNGIAIAGRWEKNSVGEQIRFYYDDGAEIVLAPGQTFVEAVPNYGSVAY